MRAKTILACAATLLVLVSATACKKEAPKAENKGGVTWMNFTDGMKKAKAEGKPVIVDFYTQWCKYCKMMDDTTYKDPEVIKILSEGFVAIKVDAEGTASVVDPKGKQVTEAELAKGFNITGYPTLFFFDAKGKPIGPIPGYSSPEDFRPALTFITSGSYDKGIKYADYLKSLPKANTK